MWIVVVLVVLLIMSLITNIGFSMRYIKFKPNTNLDKAIELDTFFFWYMKYDDVKRMQKDKEFGVAEARYAVNTYAVEDVVVKACFSSNKMLGRAGNRLHYELTFKGEDLPRVVKLLDYYLVDGNGTHKESNTIIHSNTISLREAKALYPLLHKFISLNGGFVGIPDEVWELDIQKGEIAIEIKQ